MLGNFTYCNPTKLHFGKDSLNMLKGELEKFGKNVMLSYGGGSIKKNGIYDKVVAILKACGKNIFEDGGVMPNPTVEKPPICASALPSLHHTTMTTSTSMRHPCLQGCDCMSPLCGKSCISNFTADTEDVP